MLILVDCDPGAGVQGADPDDGLALAWLRRSPEAEIVAVTVVAGNVAVETGVQVALGFLEADGDETIPVHRGAERPLVEDPGPWRRTLDRRGGELGKWPASLLTAATGAMSPVPGASAIVDAVLAHPEQLTLLALGPLTNIALALRIEPRIVRLVRGIVVMGGALGLAEPWSELNFCYDPEAAQIVLTSGAPVLVVPVDITRLTCFDEADNEVLLAADPAVQLLGQAAAPWIRWVETTRHQKGCSLHDPLAAAVAVAPSLARTETKSVHVELAGELTRGRLVAWDPKQAFHREPPRMESGTVEVVVEVDLARFRELFLSRMSRSIHSEGR